MREREGKQRAEIFGTTVRKAHLHAVASEVDPERRLGKLRGYLLRGELHFPGPVGVAIQAQVLLVGIGLRVEILDVCVRESVGVGTRGDDVSERRQAGRVESRSRFAEKNRARPVVPRARLRCRRGGGLPNPGKPPVSRIRGTGATAASTSDATRARVPAAYLW